jgi:prophage regulatory protein
MNERLLNKKEVVQITSLSVTEILRQENAGTFPKRIAITPKKVVWVGSEIEAWVQATIKTARGN